MTPLEAAQAAVVRLVAEALATTPTASYASLEAAEDMRGRLRVALVAWDVENELAEMQQVKGP